MDIALSVADELLLSLCCEAAKLELEIARGDDDYDDDDEQKFEAAAERLDGLYEEIAGVPALTAVGLGAKARCVLMCRRGDMVLDLGDRLAMSVIRDLVDDPAISATATEIEADAA